MIKLFCCPENEEYFEWLCYNDITNATRAGQTLEKMIMDHEAHSSLNHILGGVSKAKYLYSFEYETFEDITSTFMKDYPEHFV